ncbi:YwqG family protein [Vibrio sp. WXL103]|uniref:YwqG family protein n=1 Tax=Vibrio sp. WXL103 TaxID=3450710 RepID=UPI003EC555D8
MNIDKKKVNVPSVLKAFEKGLENLQRDYVAIKAIPLDSELSNDSLGLTKSKFLGFPFFPSDSEYPKDKSGKPMVLIAQINFSEVPELKGFPSSGLLQLYFPVDDWWYMGSEKIIYHSSEDLQKQSITDFSFIDSKLYEQLPICKVHDLRFKKSIDTGGSEDSQFSFMFGSKDYWDFEESLTENEKQEFNNYFSCSGHKIGGYADFTQSDPRDYEPKHRNDIQLLQIDIDDFIMFGDSGVGHIFINPDDLKSGNLERSYFYWDCY